MTKYQVEFTLLGRAAYLFTLLLVIMAITSENTLSQVKAEHSLKAAFVLNFIRYTDWPEQSSEPFELGVIGDPSLTEAFQTLSNLKVANRPIRIHSFSGVKEVEGFDIIFFGEDTDRSTLLQVFAAVNGKPVLTIGEVKNFTTLGGVINFFIQDGKLRFEISQQRARQQQVKISSRLLSLAVLVDN